MRGIRFGYLFLGLMAALTAEAAAARWAPQTEWLIQLALSLLLILGVWSLHQRPGAFRLGLGIAGLGVITAIVNAVTPIPAIQALNLLVIGVFCLITIRIATEQVLMQGGAVDADRLMGSLCVYMLLGMLWAVYYALVEMIDPGAFHYAVPTADIQPASHFLYYSFVTLTTLGYGDVVPVSPLVRTPAYLEAVVGQVYLTVLVASLVGRHVSGWDGSQATT